VERHDAGRLVPIRVLIHNRSLSTQLHSDESAPPSTGFATDDDFVAFAVAGAAVLPTVPHDESRHLITRLAAAVFESLLHAIDANDPETGAHVRRVAICAVILARAADADAARQCRVQRVALFHDIGKINGALCDVLRLTECLSGPERKLIATHADRGAEVLAPLASFYPELPAAVRSHHEWWNGRGYPRRLRGTAIPFEARVVALADVFDALTHQRSYKAALSVARAEELIAAGRGTQFDPDLTDLFLSPPVQEEIAAAQLPQRVRARPRGGDRSDPRRQAGPRSGTPEITFRWCATKGD
jgi:HD-GYP domain-containing protein (c-di-GMP phosphodiesterase class II)